MGQLEKIDCRASESLVFGGLMDKTYESLKKCNFNCRRATKIVDISHWIIVHLKDGRKISGRYDTESFASSFPAEEQIYLQEVWILDDEGGFKEPVERTSGIIILKDEISLIEFFK